MGKGVKRVLVPDFEDQLQKRPIDKKADEIKEESLRRIARLKNAGHSATILKSRVDEEALVTNSKITRLYTDHYNARLVVAKANIASYYSALYQEIFGGEVLRKFKTEKEEYHIGDGQEQRNFHPDHIRYFDGTKVFCEIKAVSDRNSKPWCSSTQLENYFHDLLTDAFETMFTPELEYAFFRYRHRGDHEEKTSVLSNRGLARKLARDTKDLLIVPANLLFLMALASKDCWINQESNKGPDEARYWKIYGHLITRLHQEDNPILNIASEVEADNIASGVEADGDLAKDLCLRDIRVIRGQSPGDIYCRNRSVRPFHITRYYNSTDCWQKYLKEHHERLLTERLGIRDLYTELAGVPF